MIAPFSPDSEYQFISPFLSDLRDISTLLASLQRITRQAIDLFNFEDCAVALLDTQRTHLLILVSSGEPPEKTQPFLLSASSRSRLVVEKAPLVLPETGLGVRLSPLAPAAPHVLVCLPMVEKERLLGVLIASSVSPVLPDSLELRQLLFLAEQSALILSAALQSEQLRVAEGAKASFLSLITHELRSPLNSINGYLDLILDGLAGELSAQQEEFVQRARVGSEYLYALLEDLLLAARTDAGQLRLKRESVVLDTLIEDVLEGLELVARDASVEITVNVPATFPALFVDTVRLQQIMRNLLGNAIHFTPAAGHVTLSAQVLPPRSTDGRRLAEISIRDTGYGIPLEYQKRIFERFFRLSPADSGRVSGQGLGLAVVKILVEQHGGSIKVESMPGRGSTFTFTLDAL